MLPPAPVLFSTTTCWRQIWDSWAATIRAVASNPPPAAIGQLIRTTCFGHICARAASGHAVAAAPSRVMNSRRFTAQCLPCFPTERIAYLDVAGDYCTAGFRSGLCPNRVIYRLKGDVGI